MRAEQQLQEDLNEAMKARDHVRVSVLRMLLAAVKNRAIADQKKADGLSDETIREVIRSEIKKRKDARDIYQKASQHSRADAERTEYEILEAYLPPELADDAIREIVKNIIRERGASGMPDFGNIMKAAMEKVHGRSSGACVAAIVRKALS